MADTTNAMVKDHRQLLKDLSTQHLKEDKNISRELSRSRKPKINLVEKPIHRALPRAEFQRMLAEQDLQMKEQVAAQALRIDQQIAASNAASEQRIEAIIAACLLDLEQVGRREMQRLSAAKATMKEQQKEITKLKN
jgi:hypothetical protein